MQLSQFKQFGDRISRDSSLLNVIASDSREGREMSSRLATATSVRGKYEALMVEAVARVKRGEPAFFYAWSPSWVNNALIPGEDVVWLPTPREALPPKCAESRLRIGARREGMRGRRRPLPYGNGQLELGGRWKPAVHRGESGGARVRRADEVPAVDMVCVGVHHQQEWRLDGLVDQALRRVAGLQ